jgi:DNA-binding MarR family transcriptional regulator
MDLENTLGPWLGKTMKMMDFYFQDVFKNLNFEVTKNQWIVLKKLSENDGTIQNELAFITDRDKTSLTRLITTMEKKELVRRVSSIIDKRRNRIYLTEKGKKLYKNTLPTIDVILKIIQTGLSEKEVENTIEVMKKIQRNILNKSNQSNICSP